MQKFVLVFCLVYGVRLYPAEGVPQAPNVQKSLETTQSGKPSLKDNAEALVAVGSVVAVGATTLAAVIEERSRRDFHKALETGNLYLIKCVSWGRYTLHPQEALEANKHQEFLQSLRSSPTDKGPWYKYAYGDWSWTCKQEVAAAAEHNTLNGVRLSPIPEGPVVIAKRVAALVIGIGAVGIPCVLGMLHYAPT